MVSLARQESLKLEIPKSVAVVGCGGVGSWTAYFLALAGVPELWLFDFDSVSDHNLNRIPLPMSAVDKPKSAALAELIHTVRPDCVVYAMGGFDKETVAAVNLDVNWIIATTDTLHSRQMVKKWADKNGVKYIEAAAEGEQGSATGMPAEWATPEEDSPGYASVPCWVGPCVFSAGVAVAHVLHNREMCDRTIRLGWGEQKFEIFDSDEVERGFEAQQEKENA
jgi:hypothetical protein